MRITHLTLTDESRTLAAMRAAMLRRSLTDYVIDLIMADAERAGLAALMREDQTGVVNAEVLPLRSVLDPSDAEV